MCVTILCLLHFTLHIGIIDDKVWNVVTMQRNEMLSIEYTAQVQSAFPPYLFIR